MPLGPGDDGPTTLDTGSYLQGPNTRMCGVTQQEPQVSARHSRKAGWLQVRPRGRGGQLRTCKSVPVAAGSPGRGVGGAEPSCGRGRGGQEELIKGGLTLAPPSWQGSGTAHRLWGLWGRLGPRPALTHSVLSAPAGGPDAGKQRGRERAAPLCRERGQTPCSEAFPCSVPPRGPQRGAT